VTNLGDLEIFSRVIAMGSMSAAGRALGLSPAVVSKRVKRLEERLGTRLFQRTTRQISLTEAGQGFYDRIVGILAGIEEAPCAARSGFPRPPPSAACISRPISRALWTPIRNSSST
jgi:DNA-binding transcriptional LysR family regulator